MKNEKGITLIELLAAVVIMGIVIVPILMLMTGTFSRTISQGKESEIIYFAQEVMEEARVSIYPTGIREIYGTCTSNSGCDQIDISRNDLSSFDPTDKSAFYKISFEALDPSNTDSKFRNKFSQIRVIVETTDNPKKSVELSSVVRKQ